jgi:hypothetical protein
MKLFSSHIYLWVMFCLSRDCNIWNYLWGLGIAESILLGSLLLHLVVASIIPFFFFFVWDGGEALIEFQRLSVFPCFFLSFFFENILLFLIYLI